MCKIKRQGVTLCQICTRRHHKSHARLPQKNQVQNRSISKLKHETLTPYTSGNFENVTPPPFRRDSAPVLTCPFFISIDTFFLLFCIFATKIHFFVVSKILDFDAFAQGLPESKTPRTNPSPPLETKPSCMTLHSCLETVT